MKDQLKEFKPSTWAINNRTAVYILTVIITLAGLMTYLNLPKESFPEIQIPQIIVQTFYPGTSPENMENLVTKPIEKEVKNLTGVKKVTSNSFQDFSVVIVEFNTNIKVDDAKLEVKDAVDKARADLPQNLPNEPEVMDIDLSEIPILYVNISGNYDLNRLKKYADRIQDKIEEMKEIKEQSTRIISPFEPGSPDVDAPVIYDNTTKEVTIKIIGNSYYPKVVQVAPGTKVRWVNEDVFSYMEGEFAGIHNVITYESPEPFSSELLAHTATFEVVLEEEGEYKYMCTPHPYMRGIVKVADAPGGGTSTANVWLIGLIILSFLVLLVVLFYVRSIRTRYREAIA